MAHEKQMSKLRKAFAGAVLGVAAAGTLLTSCACAAELNAANFPEVAPSVCTPDLPAEIFSKSPAGVKKNSNAQALAAADPAAFPVLVAGAQISLERVIRPLVSETWIGKDTPLLSFSKFVVYQNPAAPESGRFVGGHIAFDTKGAAHKLAMMALTQAFSPASDILYVQEDQGAGLTGAETMSPRVRFDTAAALQKMNIQMPLFFDEHEVKVRLRANQIGFSGHLSGKGNSDFNLTLKQGGISGGVSFRF